MLNEQEIKKKMRLACEAGGYLLVNDKPMRDAISICSSLIAVTIMFVSST